MRIRQSTLALLAGAATVAAVIALLPREHRERTGRLSSTDLRQIRAVIASDLVPWGSFTLSNVRSWPTLIHRRRSVRITAVLEDNSCIRRTTIHPDGTVERTTYPSLIEYSADGCQGIIEPVIKKDGHWEIDGAWQRESVSLDRFNDPAGSSTKSTLQGPIEPHWPGLPHPGC